MKKITLLLFVMSFFTWHTNAQFTESFDTEIPASWTVINEDGGTYTWDFQTQYPQAGAGHARIHWESAAHEDYLITPQFTVTSGTSDRISFYAGIDGTFFTETFEVRISTAGNAAVDFSTTIASETATTDADGNYTQYSYDLSSYDGQSIYVAIVATDTDRFYLYIDEFVNDSQPTDVLDFYSLWFPPTGTINAGDTFDVYARAYEAGLTDVTSGQAPGILSWIGYSTADTNPSGTGWTWIPATFNVEVGNDDEYALNLGASVPGAGTFYYASRWNLNGGAFTYGGIQADGSFGGEWGDNNNVSGVLTVAGPPNDECSGAIGLTVNADYSCGVVTSSSTLGATASPQPDDATGTPNNDVWFTFVATGPAHQIVISNVVNLGGGTSTSIDMGMSVFDDLAGCNMVAANEVGESDPDTLNLVGLTGGNTYYVRVYGWFGSVQNNNFDICVGTPPPAPTNDECSGALTLTESVDSTCNNVVSGTTVSATPSASGTCSATGKDVWYTFTPANTGSYVVSATETQDFGFSSTYVSVYTGACGSTTQVGTGCTNTAVTLDLTAATPYYVVVRSTSATTGVNFNLCAYPAPLPPANDNCPNAQVIVEETNIADASGATPTPGTIEAATNSGLPAELCNGFTGNANDDVWYSFVALTENVNVTFEINGPSVFDAVAQLYSGACGSLTVVDCADDSVTTAPVVEEIQATGLTVGDTYYVRIYQYGATATAGKSFDLKVWSSDVLGLNEFDNNQFTYFPNPVKNTLTLKAESNIQNVSVYNVLGQEVLRTAPNALDSEINMNQLQAGAYFIKVTINDSTETIRVIKQ